MVRFEAKGLGPLLCHGADVKNPFVVWDLKIHWRYYHRAHGFALLLRIILVLNSMSSSGDSAGKINDCLSYFVLQCGLQLISKVAVVLFFLSKRTSCNMLQPGWPVEILYQLSSTNFTFFFLLKNPWLSSFFTILFGSRSCWRRYSSVCVLVIQRKQQKRNFACPVKTAVLN